MDAARACAVGREADGLASRRGGGGVDEDPQRKEDRWAQLIYR
jgi:hypothetical protein